MPVNLPAKRDVTALADVVDPDSQGGIGLPLHSKGEENLSGMQGILRVRIPMFWNEKQQPDIGRNFPGIALQE